MTARPLTENAAAALASRKRPGSRSESARREMRALSPEGDPFADTPDADPSEFEAKPSLGSADKACDWSSKKRRKPVSLNRQQREWFEKNGWTYALAEHRSAYDNRKHDLWTFGDWLAYRGDETLIVQTCIHDDAAKRERKARKAPELEGWLSGDGRKFQIHGWHQPGGPGTRWQVVIREVRLPGGPGEGEGER